jgi:hypothetical protein
MLGTAIKIEFKKFLVRERDIEWTSPSVGVVAGGGNRLCGLNTGIVVRVSVLSGGERCILGVGMKLLFCLFMMIMVPYILVTYVSRSN